MDIKFVLSTVILSILFLSGCISKECKSVRDKELVLSIEYLNVLDTMSIGDTIFIRSLFSNDLIDPNYPDDVKMLEDWNFFTSIAMTRFVEGSSEEMNLSPNQILNIDVAYDLIQYSADADYGTGIIIDKHNYVDGEYRFSFSLILKKPGAYVINNISSLGLTINTSRQTYPEQCPNEDIRAIYFVNSGDLEMNNFDMITAIPRYENTPFSSFTRDGGIAFYVKE